MRIAIAAIALSIALFGAACSGNEGSAVASLSDQSGSDKQSEQEDPQEAGLAWAECMRKNGANVPDPKFDDNGMMLIEPGEGPQPSEQEMAKAQEECQDLLGEPQMPEISPEDQAEMQDNALKFAECMRAEGIDVPDPGPNGFSIEIGGKNGIDPNDPTFSAAEERCREFLPGREGIGDGS